MWANSWSRRRPEGRLCSFDLPLLISLAGFARMDDDAHVRHVVDGLSVEGELQLSPDDHAGQVVVPVASGRAADLVIGVDWPSRKNCMDARR